ncbi:rhombosortase [Photobacterium makurazakiensis]|uniref:rhombosortase n=1 Tax=Photobacterium makurazakiensis TaxID=2910234 RepID=UPI003D14969B
MSIRYFIVLATGLMALCQLPSLQHTLAWDRDAILEGEIWRLVTGNITHTNWPHMIMNSLALATITFIFRRYLNTRRLSGLIVCLAAVIGSTLMLSPMHWYAGLSGVLHGIFTWGAIKDIQAKDKLGWVLLAGVSAKVIGEQFTGGSSSSAELIGARVAVEAHLIGVIAGLCFAIIPTIKNRIANTL